MGFPRWKFEFQPKISCKPIRISLAHKFLNQTTDFVGLHRNRPCISAQSTTLAPPVGLEPTTYRLTADRSTIELWRIIAYSSAIGVKFQLALHPNFDTRDDCSKWVQLVGANRVQRMRLALVNKNWTEQVPKPRIKRSAITPQDAILDRTLRNDIQGTPTARNSSASNSQ